MGTTLPPPFRLAIEIRRSLMIEDINKVAIRGDIEAQFHLEVCYQNGMGVKRGHREAEKWARKAAEEGYAKAQIAVGMSYYTGEGLPKDHVKAYAWVNLIAAQGEEEAQDAVSQIRQPLSFSELTRAQKRAMELLSMTKSKRE